MGTWQQARAKLPYYLYRVAGAIAPHIPSRLGYRLFGDLGGMAARYGAACGAVLDNMAHVLGADVPLPRRRAIVRSIYRHQGKNYFDCLRLPALSDARVASLVTVQGLEHLEAALARGRGVIIVSVHLGNIEITAQALAMRGYPILAVMEHLRPEALYHYVAALRSRRGVQVIPADGVLRPIFRALRDNGIVGLVADRDTTRSGVVAEFFGAPAWLPDGYARLAARTGATLLPCFGLRCADDSFEVHIEPPVIAERSIGPGDHGFYMDRVLRVVERYISRYPEQWVMFQPVWRIDDGEA